MQQYGGTCHTCEHEEPTLPSPENRSVGHVRQRDEQLPRYCDGSGTPSGDMMVCRLCILRPVLRAMVVVCTAPVSNNSMNEMASLPRYTVTSELLFLPTTTALLAISSKLKRMVKSVALGPSKSSANRPYLQSKLPYPGCGLLVNTSKQHESRESGQEVRLPWYSHSHFPTS
jgi:hypothetical protein